MSGVYLVSSKPVEGGVPAEKQTFDNLGYSETKVTYNESSGVNIPEVKPMPDKPYRGMGKEDLLHFSSQPFWRRLRMICVSIIILGWLALIIAVVALVLVYPRCRDPGSRSWWQTEAVYRIYVPSFKDSDDDGVGDLAGIESKLDYIKDLGFGIISLSPFYSTALSTSFKTGDDLAITNHTSVHVKYGTMTDFDSLIQAAHDKGIYVILDFIPNQTSDEHPWFIESKSSSNNDKKYFYNWAAGTTSPNDWLSRYGGSAWELDTNRNQMYYFQYRSQLPDLNLRSGRVLDELESILDFWLNRGVDGFNVRDAGYLYEDYDLRDEPVKQGASGNNYNDFEHIYTSNQPEVYSVLERWRKFVRAHNFTTTEKLLMTSIDGGLDVTELYSDCDKSGIQMPLNDGLLEKHSPCDGNCIVKYVDGWMNKVPSGKWANWMAGDEYSARFASRFNATFINAFTIMTFLMPGTPVTYYGDEINMVGVPGTANEWIRQQPMRAIMRWNNSTNGGFCNDTCTPWASIGDVSTGNIQDVLTNLIKDLMALRAEQSFKVGDYFVAVRDSSIVSFVREFDGETGYLVAVNFGPNSETRDYIGSHDTIPDKAEVVLSHSSSYSLEDEVELNSLEVGPYGGVVVSWDYVAKEL
ncbi:alpha-glucosidase-like [Mercenaria mercenaria]|uniref:alpha-glucosidase-like n=1 Tax=Mercenaria mercenaria TaxID=6596 RepID=UPI00234EECF2|nr:alpha-glucosidase-like [Mercenaria mercenaria]